MRPGPVLPTIPRRGPLICLTNFRQCSRSTTRGCGRVGTIYTGCNFSTITPVSVIQGSVIISSSGPCRITTRLFGHCRRRIHSYSVILTGLGSFQNCRPDGSIDFRYNVNCRLNGGLFNCVSSIAQVERHVPGCNRAHRFHSRYNHGTRGFSCPVGLVFSNSVPVFRGDDFRTIMGRVTRTLGWLRRKRTAVGPICRGLRDYLGDIHTGASFRPGVTLVLNSNLKSCTSNVRVISAVSCGRVRNFPVSAIDNRGNQFIFKCIGNIPIIVVRKHIRCCRNCPVASIILPAHLVNVVKTGILFLAGTSNNLGPGFRTNSFVIVRSRVTGFMPDPLVNAGVSRLNPHFPSVDRVCGGTYQRRVFTTTSTLSVPIRGNICIRLANPGCRSPSRIGVYHLVNKSTINVDATYRTVTTGRVKVGIYNVSYVAGVTDKVSGIPLDRVRIGRATSHMTPLFGGLIARSVIQVTTTL